MFPQWGVYRVDTEPVFARRSFEERMEGVGLRDRVLCSRVLQSMWELLLRMILDALTENRGVQVEFYNRFQYTLEVRLCHRPFYSATRFLF